MKSVIVTTSAGFGIGIEYTSWSFYRIVTIRFGKKIIDIYLKNKVKK
jgi:hypothetical protein